MGSIFAIGNNKGGVGKSTITANLAHALTLRGHKCLVIDFDSQCNSSDLILMTEERDNTVYDLLYLEDPAPIRDCIYPTKYKRLDILPNEERVAYHELVLINANAYDLPKERIRDYAKQNYDYTLIDCPPNMLYFVIAALRLADFVIVPIIPQSRFSVEGLARMVDYVDSIKSHNNPDLNFLRVLINKIDHRLTLSKLLVPLIESQIGVERIFRTQIPTNSVIEKAEHEQQMIISYSPSSKGAKAYRLLAEELEGIVNGTQK